MVAYQVAVWVRFVGTLLSVIGLVSLARPVVGSESVDFNRDIRPILSERCLACHGADEASREGGLRLDDEQSAVSAADSGQAAIVPGEPDRSELIRRVTTDDDDERMPPVDGPKRLTEDQIALLRRWIEQGAPFAGHWSFRPPQRPELAVVGREAWPRNPIDRFILARLESAGLQPNPEADRYALLRRLSLDLRGLPPTMEETDAFIGDERPDAYEQLVDRLLDDPAYGERWARVWLDLARYADSRGYGSDPLRPNMWRYRDWVIDAFNRNVPFDQFTIEQLAGDLLPNAGVSQRMATAFHRNTMTNTEGGTDDEEFRVAAVKDRVDTTIQVWMGLTVGCAKCHDHKYDPITQQEYYQLFGIFNQTQDSDRPDEFPTMAAPRPEDTLREEQYQHELTKLESELADIRRQIEAEPSGDATRPLTARFVRVELPGKSRLLSLAEVEVLSGGKNVATAGKASQSSTDYDGPARLAIDGNTNGDYYAGHSTTHTRQETNPWWEVDLQSELEIDQITVWNRTDGQVGARLNGARIQGLSAKREVLWQATLPEAPQPSSQLTPRRTTVREKRRLAVERQIAAHRKTRPTMPKLPVLVERAPDKQRETHLLVKGDFLTPGERVVAGVPAAFHDLPNGARANRLGLARWIVSPKNPLTARVAVNRLWAQFFGVGLVATEEDFGTQGDSPSHPKLLDWLATEYLRLGWDTKRLVRLLVCSATYRQSAEVKREHLARDPANRLLARGPRYRLAAETIRDQALSLSGLLNRQIGGPSVYPFQPPGLWRAAFNGQRKWPTSPGDGRFRRGIYTFWRRTVPYPSMATFDAPSRELCTVRRLRTNTPLQAFVTLNDPVYVEAAQGLARRIVREGGAKTRRRAEFGLTLCQCRPAGQDQVDVLVGLYEAELARYRTDTDAATRLATDPLGPLPDGDNPVELAAWTVVANVLLNLDSLLNK